MVVGGGGLGGGVELPKSSLINVAFLLFWFESQLLAFCLSQARKTVLNPIRTVHSLNCDSPL